MVRVGLVGEDPNDTSSIKNLIEKRYKKTVRFYPLAKNVKGYHLDSIKIKNVLRTEFADKKCHFVVYIRDLDALKSEKAKLQEKINWFKNLDTVTNNKGVLLLNIWELEALIFGDIATFNSIYKLKYKPKQAPTYIKEPKEVLKKITSGSNKKFNESDCPDLFKKLDIDKIEETCECFKDFIENFEKRLNE
ncbi:MAG TPA: DUF4276 family protein [Mucilaginibacter sp.]